MKILTFNLARGFDLVLSLGVTTPLTTLGFKSTSYLDWVPSLPLLALGSEYVDQGSTILFVGSCISFLGSLFFSGYFFGRMESVYVAGVLQEAEDADSRARTRSQV